MRRWIRKRVSSSSEGEWRRTLRRPSDISLREDGLLLSRVHWERNELMTADKANGMSIRERWDFIPKEGKPPLFVIAVIEEGEWKDYEKKTMTIRNREGKYTKEYHGLLRDMGFPPQREAEDYDSII